MKLMKNKRKNRQEKWERVVGLERTMNMKDVVFSSFLIIILLYYIIT